MEGAGYSEMLVTIPDYSEQYRNQDSNPKGHQYENLILFSANDAV
jgi:hypothetical protein